MNSDIGIGNSVNDLIKAIAQGSDSIPSGGSVFIPIETADGTAFDADDAAALARIATPAAQEYTSGDIGIDHYGIAITGANDTSHSFDGF